VGAVEDVEEGRDKSASVFGASRAAIRMRRKSRPRGAQLSSSGRRTGPMTSPRKVRIVRMPRAAYLSSRISPGWFDRKTPGEIS
jgi:hypothetical protein